jgi:cation transport ATPase
LQHSHLLSTLLILFSYKQYIVSSGKESARLHGIDGDKTSFFASSSAAAAQSEKEAKGLREEAAKITSEQEKKKMLKAAKATEDRAKKQRKNTQKKKDGGNILLIFLALVLVLLLSLFSACPLLSSPSFSRILLIPPFHLFSFPFPTLAHSYSPPPPSIAAPPRCSALSLRRTIDVTPSARSRLNTLSHR